MTYLFSSLVDEEVDMNLSSGTVCEADDVFESGVHAGWEWTTQVDVHGVAEGADTRFL